MAQWFYPVVSSEISRSKPNPAMLNQILSELGIQADQALMIGDSPQDLQMAQNAKVDSVLMKF